MLITGIYEDIGFYEFSKGERWEPIRYISGKWKESMLAIVTIESNLLVAVETKNYFWLKLKRKVIIRSKTF